MSSLLACRTVQGHKSVLVLNESALPRNSAGGTRHVELFSRLESWTGTVVAANRSFFDRSTVPSEGILTTVWVPPSQGNGVGRVVRWLSYFATATIHGLRCDRPAVVWGSSPPMTAALAGYLVAKLRRTSFVLEIRDLWPHILAETGMFSEQSLVYRVLKGLERFLYRKADAIVVLAEGSTPHIVNEGIDLDKILFIPNGADPEDFRVDDSRAALRDEFGLDRFTIVYAGAHGPANGLDAVLDAAEQLANTDCQFVLVGDGSAKVDLIEAAASRSLANVQFRDAIPKSEIPRLFAAADAGLHCLANLELFKTGVSPNKLYDYMAAGLPVITNTGGDVAALVEEAKSGYAVAPNDIAAGVHSLLACSPEELEDFGKRGIGWMQANRSRTAMARRVEKLLDSVAR